MNPEFYPLAEALADLRAAGLPAMAHVRTAAGWQAIADAAVAGGFHGAVLDSREAADGRLFVALPGSRVHGRQYVGAAMLAGAHALSDAAPAPDVAAGDRTLLLTPDPLAALDVLARCWRARLTVRIAAITGSNGKTTTKDFLGAALQAAGPSYATRGNLNSAQGVPVSLLDLSAEHRYAVIEMGASAVGHIAARAGAVAPEVGVITNAAAAHLAEFGSLEQIIEGKGELVAALPATGRAILNADSPGFADWCRRAPCPVVSWGREAGDHRWTWRPGDGAAPGELQLDGEPWPVPLPGRHNGANLVAAILAARALGLDDGQIREGLRGFRPSPHRAHVLRLGGRVVLDDSYNANPTGMLAAARMLCDLPGGAAVAVLGMMAELGPESDRLHRECGTALAHLDLALLVAVGAGIAPLAEGFAAAGGRVEACTDPDAAAAVLAAATVPGDRILVKGSRSAGMERVLAALADRQGWKEETP
ncbi:MAG: UDP-N-acetylmuramoyl-tripeptide--D-alanyl-D-alanine ligase [Candidatus Krumholzibacteriia bacterium]